MLKVERKIFSHIVSSGQLPSPAALSEAELAAVI